MSTPPGLQSPEIILRDAVMDLYKPNAPATAVITRNEVCTAAKGKAAGFVRHIEFDVSGTDLVGKCIPGQSIGVIPPGTDHRGLPHKLRLYSLASPTPGEDGAGRILSTVVKRTIDEHWDSHALFLGVCSNFLCNAQVGDKITVTGPAGKKFVLPQDVSAHDYLFFATGTGIAPFRGMVMDLLAANCQSKITLVMGSPYATDLLYDDYFRAAAAKHPNFKYLTAISRETGGPDGKLYVQDRLRTYRDELAPLLASGRTLIYICGIAGMEIGIFKELATRLPPPALAHYLSAAPEIMANVLKWDRSMIHKDIHLSKRIFMEVYA